MKTVELVASALLLAAAQTLAQDLPISTDGTDPKTWDPKQDAPASGKKNHVVTFEYSEIRVLSVTVAPGDVEIPHHHQWPSIIVYDRPVKSENRDGKGNLLAPKRPAGNKLGILTTCSSIQSRMKRSR